ncbi:MAG: hypothetical protein MUF83_12975 [Acidimicrobiales bacterium]|jgi:hypothetical protein|nr:hypothetical protein [Acidimicrobiales bacterium]
MHPIERLRFVARASGVSQTVLVQETAAALSSFGDDPQGLVTACRRIVSRQPASGPLLWLTARVLTATDPYRELWEAAGAVQGDATPGELVHALPGDARVVVLGWPDQVSTALARRGDLDVLAVDVGGEATGLVSWLRRVDVEAAEVPVEGLGAAVAVADLVLLESPAIGPHDFLGVAGSRAAAAVARHAEVPVWLVGGVGRLLPARMWEGLWRRVGRSDEPWEAEEESVPLGLVDRIVGPGGPEPVAEALRRTDCPVAPELFKGDVI